MTVNDFDSEYIIPMTVNDFDSEHDGWWLHQTPERISWHGDAMQAVATGLFYKAAKYNKCLFELTQTNTKLKFPPKFDNINELQEKLISDLYNELISNDKLKLNILREEKYVKADRVAVLFHNFDSCLSLNVENMKDTKLISLWASSFREEVICAVKDIILKYLDLSSKDLGLYLVSEDDEGRLELESIGRADSEL